MAAAEVPKSFLSRHWRKGVVLSTLAAAGALYVHSGAVEKSSRFAVWRSAADIGNEPTLLAIDKPKRLTVILNPAAGKRNAKRVFEQEVAPIFHLAGIDYGIVETERVGQAKEIAGLIELPKTDGIVVVGGDGVLQEVVTGLLRRSDLEEVRKKPIGIIPIGSTNGFFASLFATSETAAWMTGIQKFVDYSTDKLRNLTNQEAVWSKQSVLQAQQEKIKLLKERISICQKDIQELEQQAAQQSSSILSRLVSYLTSLPQISPALADKLNTSRLELQSLRTSLSTAVKDSNNTNNSNDFSSVLTTAPALAVTQQEVNDFVASVLESAPRTASAAALAIARGNTRQVDVFEISANDQKKVYGVNLVGFGIPSVEVISATSWAWVKRLRYEFALLHTVMKKAKPNISAQLSYRDMTTQEWKELNMNNMLSLLASNGPYISQRLELYPKEVTTTMPKQVILKQLSPPSSNSNSNSTTATTTTTTTTTTTIASNLPTTSLDDGKFTLSTIEGPLSGPSLLNIGREILQNSNSFTSNTDNSVSSALSERVQIVETDEFKLTPLSNKLNTQINIDGELFDPLPIHVKILKKFLTVYS